jgi:hypothetical protein
MTIRTTFPVERSTRIVDFTTLTNVAAIARLRQLAAQGMSDETLATLVGWNRTDVRRAITPAPARPRS